MYTEMVYYDEYGYEIDRVQNHDDWIYDSEEVAEFDSLEEMMNY